MFSLRRWLSPVSSPRRPAGLRFRPAVHPLDDRITPALDFAAAQSFAAGTAPSRVAVGDFNQDGRTDLVTASNTGSSVSVLLNATAAGSATVGFAAAQSFAVESGPVAVAVGDINGDGRPDIITANETAKTVSVLLNTTELGAATATFASQTSFAVLEGTKYLELADFNGDGRIDIATASQDGGLQTVYTRTQVSILRNTGASAAASFAANQVVYGASASLTGLNNTYVTASPLGVGDFNGDGRPDFNSVSVITENRFWQTQRSYQLRNTTGPGATSFSFQGSTAKTGLAVGDFDADGTVEGTPFTPSVAGDFDGDGRADVALLASDSKVDVRPNVTVPGAAASFGASQLFAVGANPTGLAAADFNGDGRSDLVTVGGTGVSILANTSTNAAVTGPSLVAQFGTTGVWRYNRTSGAWDQITASNATSLATAANGNVIAAFGDAGVWYYRPAFGWSQLNPNVANSVAIDALGNAAASFPGFGLSLYRIANGGAFSAPLTSVTADLLAMNANGELVASFAGYGLWKLTQGNWKQLSGVTAKALTIASNGDVAAVFAGYGVNLYRESSGWTRINGVDATSLSIDGSGAVVANFPGYGVAKYIRYANGWQTIAPATQAAGIAADWGGHVFAAFDGYGVWEYSLAYGWQQRRPNNVGTFAVG